MSLKKAFYSAAALLTFASSSSPAQAARCLEDDSECIEIARQNQGKMDPMDKGYLLILGLLPATVLAVAGSTAILGTPNRKGPSGKPQ